MEIKEDKHSGVRARPVRVRRGDEEGYYSLSNPFEVTARRSHSVKFDVFLFGQITEAAQFIPAIEVFQNAGEDDEVHIHLSTPGGSMDATDTFLSAMHQCEGRVIVHASGGCHSCGSIILMHANEFTLSENFNMLIHNGSLGSYNDLNKFAAHAKHGVEYMAKVMRATYEGFLTPEELQAMLDGKDFWMGAAEFMERHGRRMEHFKAKTKLKAEGEGPTPRRRRKTQSE